MQNLKDLEPLKGRNSTNGKLNINFQNGLEIGLGGFGESQEAAAYAGDRYLGNPASSRITVPDDAQTLSVFYNPDGQPCEGAPFVTKEGMFGAKTEISVEMW